MAIIKLGALLTDASGKLGGQQVGAYRGTHVLQNKSVSKKTPSILQSKKRSETAYVMQLYSSLTIAQIDKWNLAAKSYVRNYKFIAPHKLNGFSLFQVCNQSRLMQNLSVLLDPAEIHVPIIASTLSVNITTSSFIVSSSLYDSETDVVIYVTPPISNGISKPYKRLRFLAVVNGDDLNSGVNLYSQYQSLFGALVNDQRIFVACKTMSAISGFSNGVIVTNFNASVVVAPIGPVYDTVIRRVNAGGASIIATDGRINWDENSTAGATSTVNYSVNTGRISSGLSLYQNRDISIPDYIDEATFTSIFSTERFDDTTVPEMEFAFNLANGDYLVRLYLANSFSGTSAPGSRVFDIAIEGNIVVANLDLIVTFGYRVGGMLEFPVTVVDGVLNIEFLHKIQNPLINAIEIWGTA